MQMISVKAFDTLLACISLTRTTCAAQAMMRMQSSWLQRCGLEGVREYTMQYSRAFANLCNAGVSISAANEAASLVCPTSVTVA